MSSIRADPVLLWIFGNGLVSGLHHVARDEDFGNPGWVKGCQSRLPWWRGDSWGPDGMLAAARPTRRAVLAMAETVTFHPIFNPSGASQAPPHKPFGHRSKVSILRLKKA